MISVRQGVIYPTRHLTLNNNNNNNQGETMSKAKEKEELNARKDLAGVIDNQYHLQGYNEWFSPNFSKYVQLKALLSFQ